MFKKILVANRGEIAIRVLRACRELGIATVAVYSEADRTALHPGCADEAVCIGPAVAAESYLNIARILSAAIATGSDAIHPGYGFLSENPDFAQAVQDAGLTFIGPPPAAMRAMGSKTAARALMRSAGVPIVPGSEALAGGAAPATEGSGAPPEAAAAQPGGVACAVGIETLDPAAEAATERHGAILNATAVDKAGLPAAGPGGRSPQAAAERLGFPLIIKAAAGGGGKGMRVVESAVELPEALESARREARNAFGDAEVYFEKYLRAPHHVEIQVLADRLGNTVHLLERECSIQRRHQKIIEETPSPLLTPALRARMGEAAVAAARAVGYVNAGTVEFLVDADRSFYFLEMNTRLQVEHPITEALTGIDLVQAQIRIAAGEPLPFAQADIAGRGHAIECRIYAEDPANAFLPSTGEIAAYAEPQGPGIRVDSGFGAGRRVERFYDPLIAKLIVWAATRDDALARMERALAEYVILGVRTNIGFLRELVAHPAFRAGDTPTSFIPDHFAAWSPSVPAVPDEVLIAAALAESAAFQSGHTALAADDDAFSPWRQADTFRLGTPIGAAAPPRSGAGFGERYPLPE